MGKSLGSLVKRGFRRLGYDLKKAQYPLNYPLAARLLYFQRMFSLVKDVPGDVVECGVGQGDSLLLLSFLLKDEMGKRKLWGFDSFEGFPEPSAEDASVRNPKKGDWSDTGVMRVRFLLTHSGLSPQFVDSHVTLVAGFFDKSLSKYRGAEIALLHIDVDLYDSYKTVLRELYPKVADGGVIMFDEYVDTASQVKFPGAQRAIDEFFGEKSGGIKRDPVFGKYYFVKKGGGR